MIKESQFKKLDKVLERAQVENSQFKKQQLKELAKLDEGTKEYDVLSKEISQIRTISDGTKETYSDVLKAVLREANEKFGVKDWKNLKKEHTEKIIQGRIDSGQSPQTIRKVAHALDYFQAHAVQTRVFKEKHIDVTDHEKNLEMLKEQKIIRKSSDSHRYRATKDECLAVVKEMAKYDKSLADVAYYQLLTGFRVSEAIRQKVAHIDLAHDRHHAIGAKGGLDNVVHTNHHSESDKAFIASLAASADPDTGRLFHRVKDKKGNYKSDSQVRQAATRLAARCAVRLGIGGDGQTFSSHCFRGAFGNDRMCHYARHHSVIDEIIAAKIAEQPRFAKKYDNFVKRIQDKRKTPREIETYEKIQWLVSTDLNHSRQDISRYYVSADEIKAEIAKYQ